MINSINLDFPDGVDRLRGEHQLRRRLEQPQRPLGELQRELLARLVGRAPLSRRFGAAWCGLGGAGELDDAAVDGLGAVLWSQLVLAQLKGAKGANLHLKKGEI